MLFYSATEVQKHFACPPLDLSIVFSGLVLLLVYGVHARQWPAVIPLAVALLCVCLLLLVRGGQAWRRWRTAQAVRQVPLQELGAQWPGQGGPSRGPPPGGSATHAGQGIRAANSVMLESLTGSSSYHLTIHYEQEPWPVATNKRSEVARVLDHSGSGLPLAHADDTNIYVVLLRRETDREGERGGGGGEDGKQFSSLTASLSVLRLRVKKSVHQPAESFGVLVRFLRREVSSGPMAQHTATPVPPALGHSQTQNLTREHQPLVGVDVTLFCEGSGLGLDISRRVVVEPDEVQRAIQHLDLVGGESREAVAHGIPHHLGGSAHSQSSVMPIFPRCSFWRSGKKRRSEWDVVKLPVR
eukprot:SM000141S00869  [mRNA]  locus=s141:119133:123470:+ [translate_table: standard]